MLYSQSRMDVQDFAGKESMSKRVHGLRLGAVPISLHGGSWVVWLVLANPGLRSSLVLLSQLVHFSGSVSTGRCAYVSVAGQIWSPLMCGGSRQLASTSCNP